MSGRKKTAVAILVALVLLLFGTTPASARFDRAAGEAINVTEACPRYLSLEVASMQPDADGDQPNPIEADPVTIQVYLLENGSTGALVLERTLRLRDVEPDLEIVLEGEEVAETFHFHRRAVLRWDDGRLPPGTRVFVRTSESGTDGTETTVSKRCDTPDLRFEQVSSTATTITWRVTNPTAEEVTFNAEVLGARPAEVRIGIVPANGEATFETNRRPRLNLVLLFVGGKLVDVELAKRR